MFWHVLAVALLVLLLRLGIPETSAWSAARAQRRAGDKTLASRNSAIRDLFKRPYVAPFLALLVYYALGFLVANTAGQFGFYMVVNYTGTTIAEASAIGLVTYPVLLASYAIFVRVVDGKNRFMYFTICSVLFVVGVAIPFIFGFTFLTLSSPAWRPE
ncbi:hypothetical protein ACNPNP_10840 [Microbacterium sp. AGC85]